MHKTILSLLFLSFFCARRESGNETRYEAIAIESGDETRYEAIAIESGDETRYEAIAIESGMRPGMRL